MEGALKILIELIKSCIFRVISTREVFNTIKAFSCFHFFQPAIVFWHRKKKNTFELFLSVFQLTAFLFLIVDFQMFWFPTISFFPLLPILLPHLLQLFINMLSLQFSLTNNISHKIESVSRYGDETIDTLSPSSLQFTIVMSAFLTCTTVDIVCNVQCAGKKMVEFPSPKW